MSFAIRLKEIRRKRGFSQQKIADAIGVSRAAIHQMEKGNIQRTSHILKLAMLLSVSPAWLEFGEGDVDSGQFDLSEQEVELIRQFRALNEEDKNTVINIITRLKTP